VCNWKSKILLKYSAYLNVIFKVPQNFILQLKFLKNVPIKLAGVRPAALTLHFLYVKVPFTNARERRRNKPLQNEVVGCACRKMFAHTEFR
jgi:hypothetical protein